MKNPMARKVRVRRRYQLRQKPLKTMLLAEITYTLGSERMVNDCKKIHKALTEIVNDKQLWVKLEEFGNQVKELAKYGIDNGY